MVKSKSQWKLFQMIAHNPEKAKAKGISQSVAKEFIAKTPSYKSLPKVKVKK